VETETILAISDLVVISVWRPSLIFNEPTPTNGIQPTITYYGVCILERLEQPVPGRPS
jgi:hypothetical protein